MKKSSQPTAIVTGAARGIGRGVAARLLAAGWNVVVADVLVREGRIAVAALNQHAPAGGRALFVTCNVAEEKAVVALVTRTVAEFGRLDGVVNNAGLANPHNGPVEKLAVAKWQQMLAVNLTGPFLVAKHAVKFLRRAPGGGAILNISSTRAFQAEPDTEAYGVTKAGLLGLTRGLAISLGPKIRVNAICPGWIDTRPAAESARAARRENHAQHPVGRVGHPEDIAEMALFLLEGHRSGFVTGQTFVCDGGMTVKMIYEE